MTNLAFDLTSESDFLDNTHLMTDNETIQKRNDLTEQYMPFAERVAKRVVKEFGLPKENFDEYLSAAYLGLMQAAERFDSDMQKSFELYAYPRVRGAIIDSIRKDSVRTGVAYKKVKVAELHNEMRTQAEEGLMSDDETTALASLLDLVTEEALAMRLLSEQAEEAIDNIVDETSDPEFILSIKQESKLIKELVSELPEKMKAIIEGFYFNDMLFNQAMQQVPGISKSWASRLHIQALSVLKDKYLEAKALLES